jgi:hypothetical protein
MPNKSIGASQIMTFARRWRQAVQSVCNPLQYGLKLVFRHSNQLQKRHMFQAAGPYHKESVRQYVRSQLRCLAIFREKPRFTIAMTV